MTLEQYIELTGIECSRVAEVCLEVGDPFMADAFYEALRAFAKNVLEDEDVAKPNDDDYNGCQKPTRFAHGKDTKR